MLRSTLIKHNIYIYILHTLLHTCYSCTTHPLHTSLQRGTIEVLPGNFQGRGAAWPLLVNRGERGGALFVVYCVECRRNKTKNRKGVRQSEHPYTTLYTTLLDLLCLLFCFVFAFLFYWNNRQCLQNNSRPTAAFALFKLASGTRFFVNFRVWHGSYVVIYDQVLVVAVAEKTG